MATFRIHEDVENANPNKINLIPSKLNEKRSTFAVLNNVQRVAKAHASKTVIFVSNFPIFNVAHNLQTVDNIFKFLNFCIFCDIQVTDVPVTKGKIFNDENAVPKDAFVPVDKFKAFTVVSGSSKNVSTSGDDTVNMETIQNTSTFR